MEELLSRCLEASLVLMSALGALKRGVWVRGSPECLLVGGTYRPFTNGVYLPGGPVGGVDKHVQELGEFLASQERNNGSFCIHLFAHSLASELPARAFLQSQEEFWRRHGEFLARLETYSLMVLDLQHYKQHQTPSEAPLHLRKVQSREDVRQYWEVMVDAFEHGPRTVLEEEIEAFYHLHETNSFPGMYNEYLGEIESGQGSSVVCCGRVIELCLPFLRQMDAEILGPLVDWIEEFAGTCQIPANFRFLCIFAVGTKAPFKRQGYASALLRQLIEDAHHHGATHVGLASSEEGSGVYRKLGFLPVGKQMSLLAFKPC